MGHDRRLVGLLAIAVGVGLVWGTGFGLIAGGALFGMSGLEPRPWLEEARTRLVRGWARLRMLAVTMPRRTTATVLMVVGITAAAAAGLVLFGQGGAYAALAGGGVGTGWALGRE